MKDNGGLSENPPQRLLSRSLSAVSSCDDDTCVWGSHWGESWKIPLSFHPTQNECVFAQPCVQHFPLGDLIHRPVRTHTSTRTHTQACMHTHTHTHTNNPHSTHTYAWSWGHDLVQTKRSVEGWSTWGFVKSSHTGSNVGNLLISPPCYYPSR